MKTPNSQKGLRKYKSVLDQQLPKSKPPIGRSLPFVLSEKNSSCFRSKFPKPKSEVKNQKKAKKNVAPWFHQGIAFQTCVNNNVLALKKPPVDDNSDLPLIPSPKTPKHPKDVLRKSLIKLKSAQYNESVKALQDIVQISRFNPYLLTKSMSVIYKGLTVLIKSLRTMAARTACQTANELFMNMPTSDGPEFLDLVHALLQKSADTNKYLREDALEALDSMVIHVPPAQSVKALLHRRIAGYNLNVRTTASKLLACVLSDSDADSAASMNEDTKTRLVLAAMRFLQDECYDIKFHGMRLITTLRHHKDFEKIFQTKISIEMLARTNRIIETIKSTNRHGNI